jgi:glucan phosphoethanolaminetransferase (alkaline phosphatase superfamily)
MLVPITPSFKAYGYRLLELLLWFAAPLAFLAIYVLRFGQPALVIAEHLFPLALLAGMVFLCRQILYRSKVPRALVQGVFALSFVSLLLLMVVYYALVVTGMRSWGKVITEELINAYARQAPGLCEAIGLSFPAALAAGLVVWLVLVGLHFHLARRFEPEPPAYSNGPVTALMLCTVLLLGYHLRDYLLTPHRQSSEPISLTLHSGKAAIGVPDRNVVYNTLYEQREKAARKHYQPAANATRRNVILIVADALRADHMQPYRYSRPTTPYLQQQVNSGQLEVFNNVHSTCSESICSMAGLLASRYVEHLPANPLTMLEVLRMHGYSSVMILGGDQTNYYNKRSLFGKIDQYYDGSMAKGYYMNDDSFVSARTAELPNWNGKPTVMQFHLLSAHILGKRLDAYRKFVPSETYARVPKSTPQQRYTNYYDNGVLQYDDFVRQILETLRRKKYLDNAIVIITADHGESLGERGEMAHAKGVHQPVIHVPLLIAGLKAPPAAPAGTPFISQIDIAPTILQELGMPIPESWTGLPIRALQAAGKNDNLVHFQMYDLGGVLDGRAPGKQWKYWVNRRTKEEFAYELGSDPQELHNVLWRTTPELLDAWRKGTEAMLPK